MLCGGLTCDSVNQKLPSDPFVIDFGLLFAVGILTCLSGNVSTRWLPPSWTAEAPEPEATVRPGTQPPPHRTQPNSDHPDPLTSQ
jgi:hypothetical protein